MSVKYALISLLLVVCGGLTPATQAAQNAETPAMLSSPLFRIYAHRGGRKWAPENTLAAFSRAVEAGVDGIELDIHRCKSGELIVIHDDTVNRTTNGAGAVKDKSLDELKTLDAGSWYSPQFKDERLPLLSEVLNLVDGKVVVNIEIKNLPTDYPGIDDELIKLLASYKHKEMIIVSSFDHQILHDFHKKAPQYKIAMLDTSYPFELAAYGKLVGAQAWNPHSDCLREDTVHAAHNGGLKIYSWTINDPNEWGRAAALGVDGIITDDPVGLLQWRQAHSAHP